ncbi:hypothetical protein [Sedimenticola sp.]|uniref:hypothetical protein n=1 Tax=Sedimenticola sp. TaxID=1940285 RepID=UPI00258AE543|nr:hypothetical protein [Sedimenticola sp.]MCW8905405.1 hypothetical protein [Sedimenticola sp.]
MPFASRALENLNFDNSYVRLPEYFYQSIDPSPLEGTHLVSVNPESESGAIA